MESSDTQYLSMDSPPRELRGAKGRVITGALNIGFGIADVVIPIITIALGSDDKFYGYETLLPGISFIILAITAGIFGIFSRTGNCKIITYLVLCVVLAIFTGAGFLNSAILAAATGSSTALYDSDLMAIYALLIINMIVNVLHCGVAITGASFTCGAVCCIRAEDDTDMEPTPPTQQPIDGVDAGMAPVPAGMTPGTAGMAPGMAGMAPAPAPVYTYPARV